MFAIKYNGVLILFHNCEYVEAAINLKVMELCCDCCVDHLQGKKVITY